MLPLDNELLRHFTMASSPLSASLGTSYQSYLYRSHHSHSSAYTDFHDSYMPEDPFGVLGHAFNVPDKNTGSGVKEGKSAVSLKRLWVSFQNSVCSILLLNLDREITLWKI